MGRAKILLVDDDMEDRWIILDALEQLDADLSVQSADDGVMALKMLDGFTDADHYPQLIVLDLNMPKMNGTETLRNLKNNPRYKNITVIIYSTSVNHLEKDTCMQLGAQSYITKPISIKESLDTAKFFLSFCRSTSTA